MPAPPLPELDWLEAWSLPPDGPSKVALAAAAVLLVFALFAGGPRWLARAVGEPSLIDLGRRRRFLALVATLAAFLSLGYVAFYLRGGPRAADAAVYWLQGRALSHGKLAWDVPQPIASFHVRGLALPRLGREAGVEPPGFPALLALGFLVGAPMVIGPLLAAAVTLATFRLARELAWGAGEDGPAGERIGRVAAVLSLFCAALRYHTAEASPRGACALFFAIAVAEALRARREEGRRALIIAYASVGLLAAVDPLSAVVAGAAVLGLTATHAGLRRDLGGALAAVIPGLLFLLWARCASTGRFFGSPASSAAALGMAAPPLGEPAATTARMAAAVPEGRWIEAGTATYGAFARALDVLRAHALDVANFEPLALLGLAAVVGRRRARIAQWALIVVVAQGAVAVAAAMTIAPAAGASLLAGALPLDHALIALAIGRIFSRAIDRAAMAATALSLAGFALHASAGHAKAAASGMGRPAFEPDLVREGGVDGGLLFFDDDTGVALARDPMVTASHGVEAARLRGDDHDRLLYDLLGHPPAHRYVASTPRSSILAWSPSGEGSDSWRFESESDWPPLAVERGTAEITDVRSGCLSSGRGLSLAPLRPGAGATAGMTVELPVPRTSTASARRAWVVVPRILEQGLGSDGTLVVVIQPGGAPLATWSWHDAARGQTCTDLPPQSVELGGDHPRAWLVVTARGGAITLDRTVLRSR